MARDEDGRFVKATLQHQGWECGFERVVRAGFAGSGFIA